MRANPELAKKLVKAGVDLAKDKDQLKYNTALILAQSAAILKDVKAGETFYRFDQPGRVLFACHFPGHYAYGMRGWITVTNT